MIKRAKIILAITTLIIPLAIFTCEAANAKQQKTFKVAWSLYVGWLPLGYANDVGIVKKWADKYGIKIELIQFNDYIESITQYTSGNIDSVMLTNMDALGIPAAGGVDTTAIIVGDYSNGNDAIILKNAQDLKHIKGRDVNLVEYSVSHYLLARALETVNLTERDIKLINTSDSDMISAYQTDSVTALVSWNPAISTILQDSSARVVFDSSQIPGEIIDIGVVKTDVLKEHPEFAMAMAGIWYEASALMTANTPEGQVAREKMAAMAATDGPGLQQQLADTHLFNKPSDAVAFFRASQLKSTMEKVSSFLFNKGLLGNQAKSPSDIGMEMPSGEIIGSPQNIKLRFTDVYMSKARDGVL